VNSKHCNHGKSIAVKTNTIYIHIDNFERNTKL